jgi:predicted ferric reductase
MTQISDPSAFPPNFITADNRLAGIWRIVLYLLFITFVLALLTVVRPHTDDGLLHQIGKNCALIGFMILSMQIVLAARFRWIERPFGMDIVIRFHKAAAIVAIVLLFLHPVLIAWGSRHWQLLGSFETRWPIWLGRLGLLGVLVNSTVSFWRRRMKIKFERWRFLHNVFGIGILSLGLLHSYRIGGDLRPAAMRAFWLFAFVLVAAIYLFHKLVRPAMLRRNPYAVTQILKEAPRVWKVQLQPIGGRGTPPYAPGQFQFVTFHRAAGLPVEEHHWTISSTPTRPGIEMTIKESGDFTATIGLTRIGDKAEVSGPFGRFSYLAYPDEHDLLFLCGGIGITPFLSMLRHMHDIRARINVLLLWGNKREEDIVAREELDHIELSGFPRLRVVHFLSEPPVDWNGERGHVNMEGIRRYLGSGDLAVKGIYICCPPPMRRSLLQALRDLGVSGDHIHDEHFAL